MTIYRASKTQVPGRQGWVIVFRHPVRKDSAGKVYRVRAGLGTRDEAEADLLVRQMDQLLENESYWNLGNRELAARLFDKRVVDIFYENMTPASTDAWASRDDIIPLPGADLAYSKVRLIGQTGVGKTTLLRQLIGSNPKRDRFPSTSTAKTTTCDIEVVLMESTQYQAVVTFMPQELTRNYVKECVVPACVAAAERSSTDEVLRKLLEHVEQRFRLGYILGTSITDEKKGDDLEDELDEDLDLPEPDAELTEITQEEREQLRKKLLDYINRIVSSAIGQKENVIRGLGYSPEQKFSSDEQDTIRDLLEESFQDLDEIEQIIDDMIDDIENRFSLLTKGEIERNKQGWPNRWCLTTENREEFIKAVNRFTSNYAPNFGRLLTPLVTGIRVVGPFKPTWLEVKNIPRLVIMDGEGLGHTPESVASLSTSITQSYNKADVILLVDTAVQPMQAAAMEVLKSICSSGHQSKLAIAFTHFDLVKGDNLPTPEDRKKHIMSSVNNGINSLRETLGSSIAYGLERSLENRVFFLAKIQDVLSEKAPATKQQLIKMVDVFQQPVIPQELSGYHPRYDTANLAIAVYSTTIKFQEEWRIRLVKEHWSRVKALSRHITLFKEDQYDSLRPVADLIKLLSAHLVPFVVNPRGWKVPPSDSIRDEIVDKIRREIYTELHSLAFQRICENLIYEWSKAFELRGTGSTRVRAQQIRNIYERAVPIPGETPRPESSQLLDEVRRIFVKAASQVGAEFLDPSNS